MDRLENYLVKFKHKLTGEILYLRQYSPLIRQWYDSNHNRLKTIKWGMLRDYDEVNFDSYDQYLLVLSDIDGYGYDQSGVLGAMGIVESGQSLYVIVDKDFPYISYDNNIYPYESLARLKIDELGLKNKLTTITRYDLIINQNSRYNS